jgi:restriction system protein
MTPDKPVLKEVPVPIPDYQSIMLPFLKGAASGEEMWVLPYVDAMADSFKLTEEEREKSRENGKGETVFANRVRWAKTYLTQAGLLESTRRGHFKITELGKQVLAQNPTRIDNNFLRQFPQFVAFMERSSTNGDRVNEAKEEPCTRTETQTPEEQIETAGSTIDDALRANLLSQIHKASPAFFENLILDLLTAMGYGGGRQDAAQRLGKTGDGGVDGVIKEDVLGLDTIYLQAKRYQPDATIGEGEIRGFSGSLIGKGSTKGVFVATCRFSPAARQFAENNRQQKIILIDGNDLTRLMVRHNVGVEVARTVEIKRVNADYFDEYDAL